LIPLLFLSRAWARVHPGRPRSVAIQSFGRVTAESPDFCRRRGPRRDASCPPRVAPPVGVLCTRSAPCQARSVRARALGSALFVQPATVSLTRRSRVGCPARARDVESLRRSGGGSVRADCGPCGMPRPAAARLARIGTADSS